MAVIKPRRNTTHEIRLRVGTKLERFPGVRDKGVSRLIAARIEKLIYADAQGLPVPASILSWVRTLPTRHPTLYARLAQCNLVTPAMVERPNLLDLLHGAVQPGAGFAAAVKKYARHSSRALAIQRVRVLHPELYSVKPGKGGYFQTLVASGNAPVSTLLAVRKIERVLQACSMQHWEDLDAERLKQWLHQQRTTRTDFGITSSNIYLKAIRAFAGWCRVELGRLAEPNPFERLSLLNAAADVRRKRRVLSDEEIGRLIASAESGPTRRRLSGVDRAMLYRVAFTVALRAQELASLTPASFIETPAGMSVRVLARHSKRRREDVLPVPVGLAGILRPWLAIKPAGARLWPGSWHRGSAGMMRQDLAVVEIPYETSDGVADFHAARHTGITRSADHLSVTQLRTFARHAKVQTTQGYLHADADDLRQAVNQVRPTPRV